MISIHVIICASDILTWVSIISTPHSADIDPFSTVAICSVRRHLNATYFLMPAVHAIFVVVNF